MADRNANLLNVPNYGFKTPKNGWRSSEQIDKGSVNNKMLQLWKDKNLGNLEEFDSSEVKYKTFSYYPEELADRRSWICKSCICHEKCQGYYYETTGLDFDMSLSKFTKHNPDLFDSLKRKCECKTCKHELDLGRSLK